jgi:tRNA(fMet)-specific endonuclease VapC
VPVTRLLDTNICIYIARNRPAGVARRFSRSAPGSLGISVITCGELCFGAEKSADRARARDRLKEFALLVEVLPLGAKAGAVYGTLLARLQKAGTPIGNNDLWIAAHAIALDVPLVSNNVREFERVGDLRLENWA